MRLESFKRKIKSQIMQNQLGHLMGVSILDSPMTLNLVVHTTHLSIYVSCTSVSNQESNPIQQHLVTNLFNQGGGGPYWPCAQKAYIYIYIYHERYVRFQLCELVVDPQLLLPSHKS